MGSAIRQRAGEANLRSSAFQRRNPNGQDQPVAITTKLLKQWHRPPSATNRDASDGPECLPPKVSSRACPQTADAVMAERRRADRRHRSSRPPAG